MHKFQATQACIEPPFFVVYIKLSPIAGINSSVGKIVYGRQSKAEISTILLAFTFTYHNHFHNCCRGRREAQRERSARNRSANTARRRAASDALINEKKNDLLRFDPQRPLEKLQWAREEMQVNFQETMHSRVQRLCVVCSERWDSADPCRDTAAYFYRRL